MGIEASGDWLTKAEPKRKESAAKPQEQECPTAAKPQQLVGLLACQTRREAACRLTGLLAWQTEAFSDKPIRRQAALIIFLG
jgi:hypothetical protein